jgi:probable HAF family extracellular repeat protein
MKSKFRMLLAAITFSAALALLFAGLALPLRLAAQDKQDHNRRHHHYRLIDMGTFGGPASFINEAYWVPAVNRRGMMVGGSSTPVSLSSTSNPTGCEGGAPNVYHAFEWRNGTVNDLGSLGGADYCSDGESINAKGEIGGVSENGLVDPALGLNEIRAVVWKGGQITDLGTLGGDHSWSWGINNSGQVVGLALNAIPDPYSIYDFVIFGSSSGTQTRAFLWQEGVMQDLGTLGGPDAYAGAINEHGQIGGQSYTNSMPNPSSGFPTLDPFFWENGTMQDIGSLGGVVGFFLALNDRGQVIGGSSIASAPAACIAPNGSIEFSNPGCDPFLWNHGTLIDLNTSTTGGNPQSADGINDAGEIVGAAAFPTQVYDAYLWRDGMATDLGHLMGDCYSEAWAINPQSQVVGDSFGCGSVFPHHAFLWENGSIVDLNNLIPNGSSLQLVFATAINDRGEIAGDGVPPGVSPGDVFTQGHAYLLIPCDENHPGVEGCDYSLVEAPAAVAQPTSATRETSSRALPQSLLRRMSRMSQYRFPGLPMGPRN